MSVDTNELRLHFGEHGYAVARGLVAQEGCEVLRQAFQDEVRHHDGPLLRQATMRREPHNVSEGGFVTNAIIHAHDLPDATFPVFRGASRDLVAQEPLVECLSALLDAPPVLVQTMFFESGRGTAPHADTYFTDTAKLGGLVAAWIALEDIHPSAGPFFVVPGSHRLALQPGFAAYEERAIALLHQYDERPTLGSFREVNAIAALLDELIEKAGLAQRALPLSCGDVVFWSSKTVHGSLPPSDPSRSRSSLTAHFIGEGEDFLERRRDVTPLRLARHGALTLHEALSKS